MHRAEVDQEPGLGAWDDADVINFEGQEAVQSLRRKPLSITKMIQIAYQLGRGDSVRTVAANNNTSKSVVGRISALARNGEAENPRSIAKNNKRKIRAHFVFWILLMYPRMSYRDIERVSSTFNIRISRSAAQRLATEMAFRTINVQKKELLTEQAKRYRVFFAQQVPRTIYFNRAWIFTDECIIWMNPQRKKVKVLRGLNCDEKWDSFVGYPKKIMVWAAIGPGYRSPLIRIDGYLNADKYIKLFEESNVLDDLNRRFGFMNFLLQEDGASPHRASITRMYLSSRVLSLPPELHWPSYSPDLSPIEECWSNMKRNIDISSVSSADDLFREASRAWDTQRQDGIDKAVASFPVRLDTCIRVNGESLNGEKQLMQRVALGPDEANRYQIEQRLQRTQIDHFKQASQQFFEKFRDAHQTSEEILDQEVQFSAAICYLLPEKIRRQCGLPFSAETTGFEGGH